MYYFITSVILELAVHPILWLIIFKTAFLNATEIFINEGQYF